MADYTISHKIQVDFAGSTLGEIKKCAISLEDCSFSGKNSPEIVSREHYYVFFKPFDGAKITKITCTEQRHYSYYEIVGGTQFPVNSGESEKDCQLVFDPLIDRSDSGDSVLEKVAASLCDEYFLKGCIFLGEEYQFGFERYGNYQYYGHETTTICVHLEGERDQLDLNVMVKNNAIIVLTMPFNTIFMFLGIIQTTNTLTQTLLHLMADMTYLKMTASHILTSIHQMETVAIVCQKSIRWQLDTMAKLD